MYFIYKREGRAITEVETLTIYMVVATIVGARLGHVLFYDPVYYFQNPLKIAVLRYIPTMTTAPKEVGN